MKAVRRAQAPPTAATGKTPIRRRLGARRLGFGRCAGFGAAFDDQRGLRLAGVLRSDDARRRGDERRQGRRRDRRFGGDRRFARKRRFAIGAEFARSTVAPDLTLTILALTILTLAILPIRKRTIGPGAAILVTAARAVRTALIAAAIGLTLAVALTRRALDIGLARGGSGRGGLRLVRLRRRRVGNGGALRRRGETVGQAAALVFVFDFVSLAFARRASAALRLKLRGLGGGDQTK